jgi:peptidoglycan/LPS O-acetylase OafA/YrhL
VLIAFGRSRDALAILLPLLVLPLLGLLVDDGPPVRDMVLNPIMWDSASGGVAFMLWQRGMSGRVRPWLLPLVLAGFGCLVMAAAQGGTFFGASSTVSGENSLARVALSPNLAFWTTFTLPAAVGWLVYRILEDPMLRFGRKQVGQTIRWLRTRHANRYENMPVKGLAGAFD